MNELHENLFKLLLELDDICNEYNIDYFLSGGTALGAIRNQCFLPWDDDIDLFITRDNWKKLYELISVGKSDHILDEATDDSKIRIRHLKRECEQREIVDILCAKKNKSVQREI